MRLHLAAAAAAAVLLLTAGAGPARGHPQCLDGLPPFTATAPAATAPATSSLNGTTPAAAPAPAPAPCNPAEACCEHEGYGCCSLAASSAAAAVGAAVDPTCAAYLRNVSCLHCSPWSAHIFAAENVQFDPDALPGLCGPYCEEFYAACSGEGVFPARLANASVAEFCAAHTGDPGYCFPDLPAVNADFAVNTGDVDCLCLEPVVEGLMNAVDARAPHPDLLYVVQQVGVILVFNTSEPLPRQAGAPLSTFLDMQEKVNIAPSKDGDERGLLSLAFHPQFESRLKFFIHYSAFTPEKGLHMVLASLSAFDWLRADKLSETTLLEVAQSGLNHNGGTLMFGPLGMLLLSLGDGGGFTGSQHGQQFDNLLGTVIRINVNVNASVSAPYTIPCDNPFLSNSSQYLPEMYAVGLRNPWRCSLDLGPSGGLPTLEDLRLFCGDVGQRRFEEISLIRPGANLGWRAFEGYQCFDNLLCLQTTDDFVEPIAVLNRTQGRSVTGGFVYAGCQYPNLRGNYVFGDFETGKMFALTEAAPGVFAQRELCFGDAQTCTGSLQGSYPQHIVSYAETYSGELLVLATDDPTPSAPRSRVMGLVDPARRAAPGSCDAHRGRAQKLADAPSTDTFCGLPSAAGPTSKTDRDEVVLIVQYGAIALALLAGAATCLVFAAKGLLGSGSGAHGADAVGSTPLVLVGPSGALPPSPPPPQVSGAAAAAAVSVLAAAGAGSGPARPLPDAGADFEQTTDF